jgi:hypothetical protein
MPKHAGKRISTDVCKRVYQVKIYCEESTCLGMRNSSGILTLATKNLLSKTRQQAVFITDKRHNRSESFDEIGTLFSAMPTDYLTAKCENLNAVLLASAWIILAIYMQNRPA